MALSAVAAQLKQWADTAALKAQRANDPDSIANLERAAEQFRGLMQQVQAAGVELESCQRRLSDVPAPRAVRRSSGMSAFAFWRLHGQAVEAIVSVYGEKWKILAPYGETAVATVPAGCTSAKTDLGTTVHWMKDHRIPAAHYWPQGRIPTGMVTGNDYQRSAIWTGYGPPEADCWLEHCSEFKSRTDSWHLDHGYVRSESGEWRHEIEVRNALNMSEAIAAEHEAKRLATLIRAAFEYGPQPQDSEEKSELLAAE